MQVVVLDPSRTSLVLLRLLTIVGSLVRPQLLLLSAVVGSVLLLDVLLDLDFEGLETVSACYVVDGEATVCVSEVGLGD